MRPLVESGLFACPRRGPLAIPERLRIVLTGHAGIRKSVVARRLADAIRQDCANQGLSRTVCWEDAERYAKPMSGFLALHRTPQREQWEYSIRKAIHRCASADIAILSLHLSYRWYERFFSPLSWRFPPNADSSADSLIRLLRDDFKADYCICLIDDIQYCQNRVANGPTGVQLPLAEFLRWRHLEVFLNDLIVQEIVSQESDNRGNHRFPFEFSPVVAVRHPIQMLSRYVCDSNVLRIYASFPISRTRSNAEFREEIDHFRNELHNDYCVFDPLTIDELPMSAQLASAADTTGQVLLPAASRWPLDYSGALFDEPIEDIRLDLAEVTSITGVDGDRDRSELQRSVEDRDVRLIDQADCVVVYRPQYSRGLQPSDKSYQAPTGGTRAEIDYALRNAGRTVFIIHDPAVDGNLGRSVLDPYLPGGDTAYINVPHLESADNRHRAFQELKRRLSALQGALAQARGAVSATDND